MEQSAFFSLGPDEQVTLAAILAIFLSKGLNADQLGILGNFLLGIGQNLVIIQTVISSQPEADPPCLASTCQDTAKTLAELRKEIEVLKVKVAKLEG
jgi:hypothetical protein